MEKKGKDRRGEESKGREKTKKDQIWFGQKNEEIKSVEREKHRRKWE